MIDLHMHTINSDGTDTTRQLLEKAESRGLEVIAITDHDTCAAYEDIEKNRLSSIYSGKIINGCEIGTTYRQTFIEVLAYCFDIEPVYKFLREFRNPQYVAHYSELLYYQLINKLKDLGFIFEEKNCHPETFEKEFFEREVYDELVKREENVLKLKDLNIKSFSNFFRKGTTYNGSPLFLDYHKYKPTLKEIIDLIHNHHGLVFLAHPFQYCVEDTNEFLESMFKEYPFDGIECHYTIFTHKETNYLLDFAKKHHLLISGGSDYHGTNKKLHELGIGNGSLNISKDIISNWPVKYYKN